MCMKERNSSLAILREPFISGTDENLSPVMHHLWKLEGGAIYFCRKGWAHATINLKDYEIVENTQVVLLPGTIIRINGCSSDFTASFSDFQKRCSWKPACGLSLYFPVHQRTALLRSPPRKHRSHQRIDTSHNSDIQRPWKPFPEPDSQESSPIVYARYLR